MGVARLLTRTSAGFLLLILAATPTSAADEARAPKGSSFEKTHLESQLAIARAKTPYFVLEPESGDLSLQLQGVVMSRFKAERSLVGGVLRKQIHALDPASSIARPFRWVGLDRTLAGDQLAGLTLRLDPPLTVDFQTSPSNFFWMQIRHEVQSRMPTWFFGRSELAVTLFYDLESLATMEPVLADSFPLIVEPLAESAAARGGSAAAAQPAD